VITSVVQRGGEGEIQLEAVNENGEFVNFLEANAGVVSPDKTERVVPLQQTGPGRYRAAFPATDVGAYLVGVQERRGRKTVGSEVTSLVAPYSPELRALAVNEPLLHDVVTLSGGGAPSRPAESFTQNRRRSRVWVDAWPYLLLLALLCFLPDVAIRRLRMQVRSGRGPTGWGRPRSASPREGGPSRPAGAGSPSAVLFGTRERRS